MTSTPASQARAMLPALLFGDRYGLDSHTLDLFTRAGLVHSLALSGQHLALAGMVAALLVWAIGHGHAALFLRLPRRTLLLAVSAPLAVLYLWLGNAPLSLIRASLMMFFGLLLYLGKRPWTLYDLLFLTGLCFLLVWPQSLFELSVQLSVLSVAGIALAMPALDAIRRLPVPHARFSGFAARTGKGALLLLATSVAVQLPTLPVVLHAFGRLSPLFGLNLLWLPALEIVTLPLAALGLLLLLLAGPQPVTDALFSLAALPAEGMIQLLEWLNRSDLLITSQGLKPSALSCVGYAAALAAAAAAFSAVGGPSEKIGQKHQTGRPYRGAAFRLLLCAVVFLPAGIVEREAQAWFAAREQRVTLRMLDVGQGQALTVEWPEGRLLLDGGGSSSPRFDPGRDVVAQALTVNRAPRLDMVLASHADLDHARGLLAILETFDVDWFGRSPLPFGRGPDSDGQRLEALRQRRGIPLRIMAAGDRVDLGNSLALEIIHPPETGRFSSNNGSLVLRLTRRGQGLALLCGDVQLPALRRILRSGADISAEVLVLPHHGSSTSLLPEFYRAVHPNLALISCGAYNSFQFPRPEVLAELAALDIPVLTTADRGELRVTWIANNARRLHTGR